jgi:2-haloacid dehalogenase
VDWGALADAWRRLYRPTIDRVTRGELAWGPFDQLQRMMLDQVLQDLRVEGVGQDEREQLAAIWGRMTPWPDVPAGLARLRERYIVAPLSNGSVRQLVGIARNGGLVWDLVLSVELFHTYKPDPRVYLGALELLQCQPGEIMMVASHVYDLRAAREQGMRTAFVSRPWEWGPDGPSERPEPGEFDIEARDIEDLARQLGV